MRVLSILLALALTTTAQGNLFNAATEGKASLWKLFDEARSGYVTGGASSAGGTNAKMGRACEKFCADKGPTDATLIEWLCTDEEDIRRKRGQCRGIRNQDALNDDVLGGFYNADVTAMFA